MKKLSALLIAALLFAFASAHATAEEFRIYNGDRDQKRVAITIDDCYGIEHVREALEISQQNDVPFTFFVLGIVIKEKDAALWQAVAASRCEIGNHTYGHYNLLDLDKRSLYNQIMKTQAALDAVLGYHYPMQVLRPPFGNLDSDVNRVIRATGYDHAILWDVESTDPEESYAQVKNGSILLFHARAKDIACIQSILPRLLEDGYELVTVSEMIGKEPVVPSEEPYTLVNYYDWLNQQ